MDLTPEPELLHAAAQGCFVAVFMALEMNQSAVASKVAALGVVLEGFARMIERAAPSRQRNVVIPLTANVEAISSVLVSGPDVMRRLASGGYPVSPGPRH